MVGVNISAIIFETLPCMLWTVFSEPGKGTTWSVFQRITRNFSKQHEDNCDDTRELVGEDNPVYEYADLKLDD